MAGLLVWSNNGQVSIEETQLIRTQWGVSVTTTIQPVGRKYVEMPVVISLSLSLSLHCWDRRETSHQLDSFSAALETGDYRRVWLLTAEWPHDITPPPPRYLMTPESSQLSLTEYWIQLTIILLFTILHILTCTFLSSSWWYNQWALYLKIFVLLFLLYTFFYLWSIDIRLWLKLLY